MLWNRPNLFCFSRTRKLCFSGLLVVCFFGFAPGASAELSQADITAAINAAVIVPKVNNNGQIFQTALYRGSSSIASLQYQTNLELGRFKAAVLEALAALTNAPASSGASSAWTTNDVAALLAQTADKDGYLSDTAYYLGMIYDVYAKKVSRISFEADPGGDLLRVWNPDTLAIYDALFSDIIPSLGGMSGALSNLVNVSSSGFESLSESFANIDLSVLENNTHTVAAQVLDEQAADESTDSTVGDAESDAESDYEQSVEEATSEYEEIPLPGVEDSYQPTPSESELEGEDLGLSDIEDPGDHNALIRLTRKGELLPEIEVDFGSDSELVNGVNRFHDLFVYLYPVLFGLLFSLKGIHMWRVVQTASTAGAVGVDPIVHLSWNPF